MSKVDSIWVKGLGDNLPLQGSQFSVFLKGTEAYEDLRVGRALTVQNEAKTRETKGLVTNLRVGALIDLIGEFGAYNITTFGRPFSALMFVQNQTDSEGVDVLDLTKLYTVVVVVPDTPPSDTAPVTGS